MSLVRRFLRALTSPSAEPPSYTPTLGNNVPDPGEVVWGWVEYEDDPTQGKDRPMVIVASLGDGWLALMLSSQDHDLDAVEEASYGRYWMDIGSGAWDTEGRASEVRLDRLIVLEPGEFRREGAVLPPEVFAAVVEASSRFHEYDSVPLDDEVTE